ncbi:MAG: hypothetical protein EPN36_03415 [Rhodanobacteraceae bacterium]|nr:MAG: hypothetical protein EPN36_03415 [Rhodanobacteraceae bacterium]
MNALDEVVERAALGFHRSAWPLHTDLRSLRVISPRWFVPKLAGLARYEKQIISGAMGLLRCSVAPLIVGAVIRLAALLVPAGSRHVVACSGIAIADVGLILMTLALGLVLALRIKRSISDA